MEMEDLENLKNDQILHCLSHILLTGLENLGLRTHYSDLNVVY